MCSQNVLDKECAWGWLRHADISMEKLVSAKLWPFPWGQRLGAVCEPGRGSSSSTQRPSPSSGTQAGDWPPPLVEILGRLVRLGQFCQDLWLRRPLPWPCLSQQPLRLSTHEEEIFLLQHRGGS